MEFMPTMQIINLMDAVWTHRIVDVPTLKDQHDFA